MMTRWVVLRVVPIVSVVLLAVTGVMVGVGRTLDNPVLAYVGQDTRLDGDLRLADARTGLQIALPTDDLGFILSRPVWSADGERLTFVASTLDGTPTNQIYMVIPAQGERQALTITQADRPGNIIDLSAAPRGDGLAYLRSESTDNYIFVTDANGTSSQQLTTEGRVLHSLPAWSPDGTQIAFYTRQWRRSTWGTATLVDLATGQQRTLRQFADNVSITVPRWTANGNALLYGETNLNTGVSRVIRLDLTSGVAAPLLPDRTAQDVLAIPAPTDARVAVVTYVYAEDSPFVPSSQINLLDPVTGTLQTVYATDQIVDGAQWSPDGRHLLLYANAPQVGGARLIVSGEILVIDVSSGRLELTLNGQMAAWKP